MATPQPPNQPATHRAAQARLKYRLRRARLSGDVPLEVLPTELAAESTAPSPSPSATTPTPGASNVQLTQARREIDRLNGVIDTGRSDLEAARKAADAARAELETVRNQAREELLRMRAEMETQRRRLQRERDDMRKSVVGDTLQRFMSPIDNFNLALRSINPDSDPRTLLDGFALIARELQGVLEAAGMKPIGAEGEKFDPNFHEAIGTATDPTLPAQAIVEVLRAGYEIDGRVIRPAMVRVNVPPASSPSAPTPTPIARDIAPTPLRPSNTE